jgi:hypothetical protein
MRGKVAIATSAAAILVFPIAGCGGDDSTIQSVSASTSTSSAPAAVATDEFITAADARCAEANAAIANLSTDTAASSSTVQQQLSITKGTLSGLKALGEPEDPDGSLADYYAAMQDQISTLKQQQTALASGDTAAYESLGVELDQSMSDAESAAGEFGLEECGGQGSSLPSGSSTTTAPDTDTGAVTPTTTTPAPAEPATPVTPVTPPGTGVPGGTGGTGTGTPPPSGGGSGGGSSGGISPTG